MATLILDKLHAGIKVCAIKAPGFGENKKASLHALSVLTGGDVAISKDDTVIFDGAGDKKAIEERCEQFCLLQPVLV
ncbi:hypothetical protein Taro_024377 [Colocasia esculenta]|uniref:Uncharacterized protein n=1 Tax=Colocasia esculenta TaxID=4460 RepID=A0A843VHA9_COLES|nr:hypothetical protein [Colocasia esculenta]